MTKDPDRARRIVLTGGPGAGKTAVLELVKHQISEDLVVLPEAASLIFSGGFWRHNTTPGKRAAQRAIYHVQRELETLVSEEGRYQLALCDRGTLDGIAYWPGDIEDFWRDLSTDLSTELQRYDAVIHLRSPTERQGYNNQNPFRTENAQEAGLIDERILAAWEPHPRRYIINSTDDFLEKANQALTLINFELAKCRSTQTR